MKKILFTLSLLLSLTIEAQTIAPSGIYQFKKTITTGQFSAIGVTPQTLISAPGSGKRISIIQGSVNISRTGGTTNGYTWSSSPGAIVLLINGGAVSMWQMSGTTFLNSVTNQPADLFTAGYENVDQNNYALTITTDDGSNPSAGDNSIIITFLYTITNLN